MLACKCYHLHRENCFRMKNVMTSVWLFSKSFSIIRLFYFQCQCHITEKVYENHIKINNLSFCSSQKTQGKELLAHSAAILKSFRGWFKNMAHLSFHILYSHSWNYSFSWFPLVSLWILFLSIELSRLFIKFRKE